MENIQYQLEELKEVIVKLEKFITEKTIEKESNNLLTFEEACSFLKISKPTLYKLTSQKKITHYKPCGKKIYFYEQDLKHWIDEGVQISCDGYSESLSSMPYLNDEPGDLPY